MQWQWYVNKKNEIIKNKRNRKGNHQIIMHVEGFYNHRYHLSAWSINVCDFLIFKQIRTPATTLLSLS